MWGSKPSGMKIMTDEEIERAAEEYAQEGRGDWLYLDHGAEWCHRSALVVLSPIQIRQALGLRDEVFVKNITYLPEKDAYAIVVGADGDGAGLARVNENGDLPTVTIESLRGTK